MRMWILLFLVAAAAAAKIKDPCSQPRKVGPCEALVPRWYYSAKAGECQEFSWGGCQANGNNFISSKACEKQCCPKGCGDPCKQPQKVGPCYALIPRYYYSPEKGKCLNFYWGGCQANGNNFISLKACEKQCCPKGCGDPCKQPQKVGPCKALMPRYYYSPDKGKCLKFNWGGCNANGNNFETLADCNMRCNPCLQRPKVRFCKAKKPRYYFSTKLNRCVKLYWGGCQADGNSFSSLEACIKQCSPCEQTMKVGPCRAAIPRYYYSTEKRKCLKFSWGGCKPNGNNFETLAECSRQCCRGRHCGYRRPKFCYLPAVVGRCRARLERFFFDGKVCRRFYYGGCGGNENNFETIEECQKVCRG